MFRSHPPLTGETSPGSDPAHSAGGGPTPEVRALWAHTVEKAVPAFWNGEDAETVPHAEVVGFVPHGAAAPPDGTVSMAWTDVHGFTRIANLVRWWRLDRQGLGEGVQITVEVQARQRRDRSCPQHHVSAELVVTSNPKDKAEVMIGDPRRPGSWAYGVQFHGALLIGTVVIVGSDSGL